MLSRWIQSALSYCPQYVSFQLPTTTTTNTTTTTTMHVDELAEEGDGEEEQVFATAVYYLLRHDVEEACCVLYQAGYDRLAVQVSDISKNYYSIYLLIDCSASFRAQMKKQLDVWTADGILDQCSSSQRILLWLLAGYTNSLCTLSLSWIEQLGILLWYCNDDDVPVSAVLAELLQWVDHSAKTTITRPNDDDNDDDDDDNLGLALVKLFWSMQTNGPWGVKECLKNGGRENDQLLSLYHYSYDFK